MDFIGEYQGVVLNFCDEKEKVVITEKAYKTISKYEVEIKRNSFKKMGTLYIDFLNNYKTIIDNLSKVNDDMFKLCQKMKEKISFMDIYDVIYKYEEKYVNTFFTRIIILEIIEFVISYEIQYNNTLERIKGLEKNGKISKKILASENEILQKFSPKESADILRGIINTNIELIRQHINCLEFYYNIRPNKKIKNMKDFDYYTRAFILPLHKIFKCYEEEKTIYSYNHIKEKIESYSEKNKEELLYKELKKTSYPIRVDSYLIEYFRNLLDIYFNLIMENKMKVCKCQNCGKYFLPISRSDEKYCNSKYKNNMTCKEYGPQKKYIEIRRDNKAKNKDYKLRQTYTMKIKREENTKRKEEITKDFEEYKANYKKKKETLNEESLLKWIESQKKKYEEKYSKRRK